MVETVTRAPSGALAARVRAGSGVNVYACYQCTKCSTGCPVAALADVHPAQMIRAVQLGDEAMSIDSRLIWLCTGCETCTTRCPVGVDVASVVEELRILARYDGRVRRDMPFARMLDLNYRSFRRWGRLYEIELVVLDILGRPRAALDAMRLGLRMLAKGRVRPLPGIGDRAQMRRMSQTAEDIEARRRNEARVAATGSPPGSSVATSEGTP